MIKYDNSAVSVGEWGCHGTADIPQCTPMIKT